MYKNQLQELAQRSCFNLPSYACIREGPDHAPRFKASVNFNGEIFEGSNYCTTLRQAEHAAAEIALNTLSTRGPSRALASRVLDETGVYKNLLQETSHRAGLNLPVYITVRSGPGHLPVFTCTVELATMSFTGESAKTKKQAEKNAAMAAWSALKQLPNLGSSSQTNRESENSEEQEQVIVARALSNLRPKDEINNRSVRQREQQQQARRRVMLNSVAVPSHNNNLHYQQWRALDLLSDISVYQQQQQQQQNCYLALPASPYSRILAPQNPIFQNSQEPSSSRVPIPGISAIPVHIRNRSQVKIQEIPAPLEEHQKDEDEWLNGKSDVTTKPIERDTNTCNSNAGGGFGQKATTSFSRQSQQTQIRTVCFRPLQPPLMASPARTRPVIPPPMLGNCTKFRPLHTMAPAVNIRSVIPVCAAPPMRPPSSSNPTTAQKKDGSSEGEISGTSSKLSKLQL